jgi:hypothetical protein
MKKCLILILLTCATIAAFADTQQKGSDSIKILSHPALVNSAPDAAETPVAAVTTTARSPFSSFEFMLSLCILVFGLFVICMEVWLAKMGIIHSEHIFKCIIITLIITGSLLLITAGYSNNQITGITGILGSISGYLLAKSTPVDMKGLNAANNSDDDKAL